VPARVVWFPPEREEAIGVSATYRAKVSSAIDAVTTALLATGALTWLVAGLVALRLVGRQVWRRPWLAPALLGLGPAFVAFRREPELCTAVGVGLASFALLALLLRFVSRRPALAALAITALACVAGVALAR
jgi:hypothetical protein